MQERTVKWILIISMVMFLTYSWPFSYIPFIGGLAGLPFYNLSIQFGPIELLLYFINRAYILFFLLTITVAALFTTGLGKRELLYKLSIYLFTLSMGFLFIRFLQMLIGWLA